ncbi:insulinase family protein [bacterium]|nr:MAG: insulinase family protein [bacterium]
MSLASGKLDQFQFIERSEDSAIGEGSSPFEIARMNPSLDKRTRGDEAERLEPEHGVVTQRHRPLEPFELVANVEDRFSRSGPDCFPHFSWADRRCKPYLECVALSRFEVPRKIRRLAVGRVQLAFEWSVVAPERHAEKISTKSLKQRRGRLFQLFFGPRRHMKGRYPAVSEPKFDRTGHSSHFGDPTSACVVFESPGRLTKHGFHNREDTPRYARSTHMAFRPLAFYAFLTLAAVAVAQNVKVERYQLPNGMTVILHEDHSVPVATVNIWYGVGSKDEMDRRSGFAHLFEHLMFMGTKRVPNGQFDVIMEAQGGSNNASTAEDRTNYYSLGPSNLLPTLLWLDADRLEALGQNIDQTKLDLQRDVVKNERRQNVENSPYGKAYEAINALMFPMGHPYAHSVIGSMDDLSAAQVSDVSGFFGTYYIPNNASLVVAGDFDPAKIKPLVASLFGTLPRKSDPPRLSVPPLDLNEVRRSTLVDRVEQPKLLMVWHAPRAYGPGSAETALAASVLADGTASRLYQRLVVKDKVATDVGAFVEPRLLGSLFYLDVTPADGVSLDKLESAVDAALKDFAKSGPTADELGRQSAKLERGILESLQNLDEKADRLNEYQFYFGEPNSFQRVLDSYRKATPASVKRAAASTLDLGKRLIVRVVPQEDAQATSARDEQPPIEVPAAYKPTLPTTFTLSNGVRVDYWSRPELPLMRLTAQFGNGSDTDRAGKAGIAALAADMLDEGTRTKTSEAFAAALDRVGVQFEIGTSVNDTRVSFTALTKDFAQGAALFSEAVADPRLAADDFARVKESTVADLQQQRSNPTSLAAITGYRELFGPNHPSGRSASAESVEGITLDEVKMEYGSIFQPGNLRLFVGGSLTPEEAKAALEKSIGAWKATATKLPTPTYPAPANDKLRVILIDRPDSPQTTIRVYAPGFAYTDPRRVPLTAAATVLGGSFTSRLNQNLREKNGYTYGAGSSFSFQPQSGLFSVRTDVRTDVTGAALKEILAEMGKVRTGDIAVAEVGKAGSTLRNSTITPLASLSGLLSEAADLAVQGLGFDALGNELTSFQALSPEAINEAIRSGILFDRAVIVLVGDRKAVLEQLGGLGLPTPEEVK